MSRARWPILVVRLFGFARGLLVAVLVGKILDLRGSFPAVFSACAGFETLAHACAAFTRATGRRRCPVMVA